MRYITTKSSLLSKDFLNAQTCCAHLALSTAPHLIGRQREDGDRVPTLHLSHHRVLTHSSQQLHAVYRWRKGKKRAVFIKRCWLNLWPWMRDFDSHLSKMRLVSVLLYLTSCLNSWRQRKTHISNHSWVGYLKKATKVMITFKENVILTLESFD